MAKQEVDAVKPNGLQIIQSRVGPSRAGEGLPWVHLAIVIYPERVAAPFTEDETPLGHGVISSPSHVVRLRRSTLG
jgi:hypothetical protein